VTFTRAGLWAASLEDRSADRARGRVHFRLAPIASKRCTLLVNSGVGPLDEGGLRMW
jgi:hypothetical protein